MQLNKILTDNIADLENYVINELAKGKSLTIEQIRDFHYNKKSRESFNKFIDAQIKTLDLEFRTIQVYRTFLKHLNSFNGSISFIEIDRDLIKRFNRYLETELKIKGAARKKYFDKFKVMYRTAAKAGLVEWDEFIFDDLKIKVEDPVRLALSEEEINKIKNFKFKGPNKKYNKIRDIFLLLCSTGLYYNDLLKLKKSNIKETNQGSLIHGKRGKNNNNFFVPLHLFPEIKKIINKYSIPNNDQLISNLISEQKFNDRLKELSQITEINKPIMIKTGRHSFTDRMISRGYPRALVSRMLGHKKEATTQEYYEMNEEHIFELMKNYHR